MIPFASDDPSIATIATIIGCLIAGVLALVILAVFARYFRLWIQSKTTSAGIGIWDLLGMTFRKVNPSVIVRTKIMAVQAGIGEDMISSKAPVQVCLRRLATIWTARRFPSLSWINPTLLPIVGRSKSRCK